jgi:hypothetical protein
MAHAEAAGDSLHKRPFQKSERLFVTMARPAGKENYRDKLLHAAAKCPSALLLVR